MRQLKTAAIAAMFGVGLFASAAQASTITYNLTLQDTVPGGVSGTGTLTIVAPLLANNTYTPGPSVTLLDFVINAQDFNETGSFTSIHTNASAAIDAITTLAFSPGFLSTGSLTFTYSGNGQFGSGVINLVAAQPTGTGNNSTTPLPAALPLFATGSGLLGFLGWRRKRKNVTSAA